MKIGFTGTRTGMTGPQEQTLRMLMHLFQQEPWADKTRFDWHEGDCTGSDAQSVAIAREFGFWIIAHPPKNTRYRAFAYNDEMREPQTYHVRDEQIVVETDRLVATPAQFDEVKRGSGTWLTIRYARRYKKPRYIIWPDGRWTLEEDE
jgi:hypothetical protein